jgi:hypothetical protein
MNEIIEVSSVDANGFGVGSIEKAEKEIKKPDKTKWALKKCPLVFCNPVFLILKFNEKYNLKFLYKNREGVKSEMSVEYIGEIGNPNFKYRIGSSHAL